MVARAVRPSLLIVSAGFDYVAGDSVGDLGIDVKAAAPLAAAIRRTADEHCGGSVAYVLEGGYGIEALTSSIGAIARVQEAAQTPAATADAAAVPQPVRHAMQVFLKISQGSG